MGGVGSSWTETVAAGQAARASAATVAAATVPGTQTLMVNARPVHRYS
jgi:hypothetical protein